MPDAPAWLTESFAVGVTERSIAEDRRPLTCWLAQFDPLRRPCAGPLERFHFVSRQRVHNALGELLPWGVVGTGEWNAFADLIMQAEWDARNGGIACGHEHHPRFDHHQGPSLYVPVDALPDHVVTFAEDWGLEDQVADLFPVAARKR